MNFSFQPTPLTDEVNFQNVILYYRASHDVTHETNKKKKPAGEKSIAILDFIRYDDHSHEKDFWERSTSQWPSLIGLSSVCVWPIISFFCPASQQRERRLAIDVAIDAVDRARPKRRRQTVTADGIIK